MTEALVHIQVDNTSHSILNNTQTLVKSRNRVGCIANQNMFSVSFSNYQQALKHDQLLKLHSGANVGMRETYSY
jgi:hypothetical protein